MSPAATRSDPRLRTDRLAGQLARSVGQRGAVERAPGVCLQRKKKSKGLLDSIFDSLGETFGDASQVVEDALRSVGVKVSTAMALLTYPDCASLDGAVAKPDYYVTWLDNMGVRDIAMGAGVLSTSKRLKGGDRGATQLVKQAIRAWGCERLGKDLLPKAGAEGPFDRETAAAVEQVQLFAGLNIDGVVGANTLNALDLYVGDFEGPLAPARATPEEDAATLPVPAPVPPAPEIDDYDESYYEDEFEPYVPEIELTEEEEGLGMGGREEDDDNEERLSVEDPADIDVIDVSDYVGSGAAATRLGEVCMTDVRSMVKNVLGALHSGQLIGRLNIIDHGNYTVMEIGDDVIWGSNVHKFTPHFARLAPYFANGGIVHVQHCRVGNDTDLIGALARSFGVPVYAGTGRHNPVYRLNFGHYVRVDPDGTVDLDAGRPI